MCAEHRRLGRVDRNRRKNNKRRKARIGARYRLADIAQRDGCKCHLCGKKVNMALPGTEPMGPTIDHLIPVSAGGTDDPANVRLAHRACNIKRGARGEVQLLLIA